MYEFPNIIKTHKLSMQIDLEWDCSLLSKGTRPSMSIQCGNHVYFLSQKYPTFSRVQLKILWKYGFKFTMAFQLRHPDGVED